VEVDGCFHGVGFGFWLIAILVCFGSKATWTMDWVIRRPKVLFRPEDARRPDGGVPLEERVFARRLRRGCEGAVSL